MNSRSAIEFHTTKTLVDGNISWRKSVFLSAILKGFRLKDKNNKQIQKSLWSFNLKTIEIWLILPVVICLFQGLSHACLRITALQESAHGSLHQTQSAAKMLRFPHYWIPCAKRQANTWTNGAVPSNTRSFRMERGVGPCRWMKLQTNASQGAVPKRSVESIHLCESRLAGVFWRTIALSASDGRVVDCHGVDGSGGLGFDSGEGAWEMATTSTEGSRRANCPMPKQMMRQRKEIGAPNAFVFGAFNGGYVQTSNIE